jgi:membrane-associated phospholipid phosphatase
MDARRLSALDRVVLVYQLVPVTAILLSLRDGGATGWPWLLVAHALVVAVALTAPRLRQGSAAGRFLAEFYPFFLLPGFYGEIDTLTLHFAHAYDHLIQRWEVALFGTQVAVTWVRAMPVPALAWLLHLCYLSYYGILASVPLGLWFTGRHAELRRGAVAVIGTLFFCYGIFIFFPVQGPRLFFPAAVNAATATLPARMTEAVLAFGNSWGAAFPSSHVAASVVASGVAWLGWRPLGRVLAPLTAGLALGTVYSQIHYAVDAAAGLGLGLVVVAVLVLTAGRGPAIPAPGEVAVQATGR